MGSFYTISRIDTQMRTKYVYRRFPIRWIDDHRLALHLSRDQVKRLACDLVDRELDFSVQYWFVP